MTIRKKGIPVEARATERFAQQSRKVNSRFGVLRLAPGCPVLIIRGFFLDRTPSWKVRMAAKPVAILMGSQSDWATLRHAAETLDALGVGYGARIVSPQRTPERLYAFAKGARQAGFKVIIAGAGGAAHLPGMTAALTTLPVFGVPVESKAQIGRA